MAAQLRAAAARGLEGALDVELLAELVLRSEPQGSAAEQLWPHGPLRSRRVCARCWGAAAGGPARAG
eukprot:14163955-Alexandrium_andersonii.AAC.1